MILIVISALALVALSGALAIALGRAAARGDDSIREELAPLRARGSMASPSAGAGGTQPKA
jgi:hypothetical protein